MLRLGKLLPALAALAGLALAGGPVRAGIVLAPGPSNPTIAPVTGGFKWTYNVQVPGALNVQPGDSFTILDFAGFKSGTAFAPTSDWTFSSSLTGPADPHHILTPPDDPTLPNLTWTYHGAPISGGGSGVQVTLFGFGAESTGSTPEDGLLYSFIHRDSDGKFVVNSTPAPVPVPQAPGPHNTPEPGTLALLALGLPVLGVGGLSRRRTPA